MIKGVFFDLFFTLIYPQYFTGKKEYDMIGISAKEWEYYAENEGLYNERALGNVKDEREIIERIVNSMPYNVNDNQIEEILNLRQARMRNALLVVDEQVLHTIREIYEKGIKISLISNADLIDCRYWEQSPLASYFHDTIFSCNIGLMKPDVRIYEYALSKLNIKAEEGLFVGDGGSDELIGAKKAGLRTVLTEYLDKKEPNKRERLLQYADFYIHDFNQLIKEVIPNC